MKLIEEIKKAEEKADKMKKEAEIEGQKILEKERDNASKAFAQLEEYKDRLIEKKLTQAKEKADKDIKVLDQQHQAEIKKLEKSFKDNKSSAIKNVQEIILKWPSSQ
jgi:V/A-type H+-transporting ATPase subunit G/H